MKNKTSKSIATGVAVTMAVGTAAAVAMNMSSGSMNSQKKKLKKNATNLIRTVGDIAGTVSQAIK